MKFDEEYDIVHVDEKWFNEDKVDRAYLLLDGEEPPPRDRKSKRFIPKMMFLAAVARPSVNRKKGTLCSRNVAYVDRPLYKHYIIEEVIPDIKAKWPASEHGKTIFIQQDNATPRVPVSGPDVVAAGTSEGWNIRLLFQSPNSPDLNVLDLGYSPRSSAFSTASRRAALRT
ncbi:hypothetical protein PC121_g13674 [Phytophthora cactorum]|nr:hypothetical protein PC121_g13674 [Phytophthora cactorum]KAG4052637.1 hypothetical protein PC123_g12190 [Phytophthora cactorum]